MDEPTCPLCEEPFEPGDMVTADPLHQIDGTATHPHIECALRSVLGGIGHHQDHAYWCETMHDPDGGVSFRESSRAVWQMYRAGAR